MVFYKLVNTFTSTEGGTRTHTSVTSLDFESSASAIPPLRLDPICIDQDAQYIVNFAIGNSA
jgi:hypothetical protein